MILLEREEPLVLLEGALTRARDGRGHNVFIGGEAGIGKTSLVESFVRSQEQGVRILWGACEALSTNDLLGGQIQLVIAGFPPMIPQVKSNRLRGIAVTTAKRSNAVPDIPTVGETVPGYEAVQWFAVLGPTALPKEIVARWNREIDRMLQLPDVKERMAGEGMEPAGGSPERFREVLKRDVAKWQKVVKTASIKPGS